MSTAFKFFLRLAQAKIPVQKLKTKQLLIFEGKDGINYTKLASICSCNGQPKHNPPSRMTTSTMSLVDNKFARRRMQREKGR